MRWEKINSKEWKIFQKLILIKIIQDFNNKKFKKVSCPWWKRELYFPWISVRLLMMWLRKQTEETKKKSSSREKPKIKAIQKIMLLSFIYVCSFHSMLPLSFFFLIIISHSYNNVRQMMLMRYIQSIISNLMHEKYLWLHLIWSSFIFSVPYVQQLL